MIVGDAYGAVVAAAYRRRAGAGDRRARRRLRQTDSLRLPLAACVAGTRRATELRHVRGRVLDVGCGPGRVALELRHRGHEVVGIDTSEGSIAVARKRGLSARPRPGARGSRRPVRRLRLRRDGGQQPRPARATAACPAPAAPAALAHRASWPDRRDDSRPSRHRRSGAPRLSRPEPCPWPSARARPPSRPLPRARDAVVRLPARRPGRALRPRGEHRVAPRHDDHGRRARSTSQSSRKPDPPVV